MPRRRRISVTIFQILLIIFSLFMFLVYILLQQLSPLLSSWYLMVGVALAASIFFLETIAYDKIPAQTRYFSFEQTNSTKITPQAIKLSKALSSRGIQNKLEHNDGHKHVDIYIPEANLYLEIDGKHHLTNPEYLFRDLLRDAYSHNDGRGTIRIPNFDVDNNLNEIADSIAEVARKRNQFGTPATRYRRVRY